MTTTPTLQQQAEQAIADWRPAPADMPAPTLRPFHVTVVTDCQRRFEFEAVCASTFDAFELALNRFHHCARIEAKPVTRKKESPHA